MEPTPIPRSSVIDRGKFGSASQRAFYIYNAPVETRFLNIHATLSKYREAREVSQWNTPSPNERRYNDYFFFLLSRIPLGGERRTRRSGRTRNEENEKWKRLARERRREEARSGFALRIFQKGNYKRAGLEMRGAAIKRNLYETRDPGGSGVSQMEEVDGAYRDIPTLFIELRNPKIKSCHCNYTREKTKRLTGEKERERGSQVWRLLRKRIGFETQTFRKGFALRKYYPRVAFSSVSFHPC